MNQKFDINKIIEHYNLNVDEVAKALFPHVRYQKLALDRVLKGEATLDTNQLESLATLVGVFVHDLFFFTDGWKGSSEDGRLVFIKNEYKVKLNYKGTFISIFKKENLVHQELISNSMSISEFIEFINKFTNN